MIKYYLISCLIATCSLAGLNAQDCLSLDITDWSMGPTRYNPAVLKATVENTGTDTLFYPRLPIPCGFLLLIITETVKLM